MIVQGKDVVADLTESCDVVVVGSGAGGAVVAAELAEAGHRVIVVEEGGYYTKDDFSQREDDMFAKIEGGRGFDVTDDLSVNLTYSKCVGGSTVHYWADSYRAPVDRLQEWERRFGLRGYSRPELDPYWDRIEKALSIEPAPDYMVNENARLVQKGAEAMGWPVERTPQARKSSGADACRASGFCMSGCSYDAKQSMLVTYVPRAIAAGAKLFSDCRATGIEVVGGKATGIKAQIIDRKTKSHRYDLTVKAKVVVLAAGGFATPALLLKNRLCNRSGQVGRNFYTNAGASVFAFFDHEVKMYRNIPAPLAVHQFRLASSDRNGHFVEGGYLLMPSGALHPGTLSIFMPGFGKSWRHDVDRLNQMAGTYCIMDDENPGRITLDGDRPVYSYSLRGRDLDKTRDFIRKSAQIYLAAGAKEVLIPDCRGTRITDMSQVEKAVQEADLRPASILLAGPHPLGTCRMSEVPGLGVVKSGGETHEVRNLFICDGSAIPSSISVDPSLTIMAFAAKAANHINAEWSHYGA